MRQRATALGALLLVAGAVSAGPKSTPQVALVSKLYHEFAFEAVIEEPEDESALLIEQPREVMLQYFDSKLADLLLADRQCVKKTDDVCRLDFSPLWGNQDPVGGSVKITQGPSPETVIVQLRYGSGISLLKYKLSKAQGRWRISDIEYSDKGASLRRYLEAPQ